VRFTLLFASTALAAGLLLSACSSGSSSAIPGGSQVAAPMSHHGQAALKPYVVNPDKKNPCPSSKYYECFDISASSSGPYVEWSSTSTLTINGYDMLTTVKGKSADKKLSSDFSPDPGNPTYQYITELKPQKASTKVKFVDATYACYYLYPSVCSSTYYFGMIPT
jgi:hypothetical protein